MKKVFLMLFMVLFISGVIAIDDILPNLGESESNSVVLPGNSEANSLNLDLLDSPKIQGLLREEAELIGIGDLPVIVQFESKLSPSARSELLKYTNSIDHEYSIIPAAAFTIDVSKIGEIASLSFVKSVEYDSETKIVLAQSTTQIGASRVWIGHGVEGDGVSVAILDTGIDNDHRDLKNVIKEQDFTGEGTDDLHGHGTHVASTVAGSGVESGGLNKGVAPKASLFDVKVLDSSGSGSLSDTIAGIEWAVLNGADVISMSLGAQIPCNGLDATSLASDAAVKRGVHVIVAAGNTGPLPGTIGSPGCAREVVTVGAVDRLDSVAVFSSRGPTLDGRTKPDIVAPGVLIIAAKNGGGYTALSGTSMATPHVSGVVALILSEKSGLSPEQVKKVLMDTAKDLGESGNTQGTGRVEAYDAFIEATGLDPEEQPEEDSGKEEAERKSKDEGYVDDVDRVDEKKSGGKKYYVVEGGKDDEPSRIIRVWVDKESGSIELVQNVNFFQRLLLYVVEFFESIANSFG